MMRPVSSVTPRAGNSARLATDPPAGPASERTTVYYGAGRDLEPLLTTHLFGMALNHGGSTFLQMALATCRATWNLPEEGKGALGYAGPTIGRGSLTGALKIWAACRRWRDVLTDASAYNWPRTRKAWYFQAFARDPQASIFFTKSPSHLLLVDQLIRHFANAKFLFVVRNPYAVCEGICRNLKRLGLAPPDGSLPEKAARHVVACLEYQRRNVEEHGERSFFFTYEQMCANPERVASGIRALVPELKDLDLRQRLPVKGRYDEMLTDMNGRQIARLEAAQITAFNRVFRKHLSLLERFGYEWMEPSR